MAATMTAVAEAVDMSSRPATPPASPSIKLTSTPVFPGRHTPIAVPGAGTAPIPIPVPGAVGRVPNKHIPYCSPGPAPGLQQRDLPSPPNTPPQSDEDDEDEDDDEDQDMQTADTSFTVSSLLHPPQDKFTLVNAEPPIYGISAGALAGALDHVASQPLPDPHLVFPWLHGLTTDNMMQLSFFRGLSRDPVPRAPQCLRAVTVVKAGGNLLAAKIKGAVSPDELLLPQSACAAKHADHCQGGPCFQDIDPLRGFSVRNFRIQCCKLATLSDIVVYGDDATPRADVERLAMDVAAAQAAWRSKAGGEAAQFSTYILTDDFATVERDHPEIVAYSSAGFLSDTVVDLPFCERLEMAALSQPTEIAPNVFMGQTPDEHDAGDDGEPAFHITVEATDYAQMPDADIFAEVESFFDDDEDPGQPRARSAVAQISFPSSGSLGARPSYSADADGLIAMCHWIWKMTVPAAEGAAAGEHGSAHAHAHAYASLGGRAGPPRRILLHCADGYTETSLLGLAYYMFAHALPARDAWIALHAHKKRNFFAYPSDKQFLESIERRIIWQSPCATKKVPAPGVPAWARRMDGSLPSRVLPYMYLGNLAHASNPGLLRALGITHVLSVGEPITWHAHADPAAAAATSTAAGRNKSADKTADGWGDDAAAHHWPADRFLAIDRVQDNGVDSLAHEFDRCLAFVDAARAAGGAALVHCRVGVSRSATICIAEVMRSLDLSFPRA